MNAYHNLAGWLRDSRAILSDRTELADSYYWALRDFLQRMLTDMEIIEDESELEDPEDGGESPDDSPADGDTEVELLRSPVRSRPGQDGRRADARGNALLGRPAPVASHVPHPSEEVRRTRRSAAPPVAGARVGLGVTAPEPQVQRVPFAVGGTVPTSSATRSVPRGTRRSKGGKRRGTKRPAKR